MYLPPDRPICLDVIALDILSLNRKYSADPSTPTGVQEVASLIPTGYGNILLWSLIMKYFLWSFSPFPWFRKNILQFLVKECAQVLVNHSGLGGSVGCAVRLETRRSRVQPQPRLATFFCGDCSWSIFYGHSFPSADSRRADISFWRKNVHNTG